MEGKSKKIVLWVVYGILMVATILIFVFSGPLFGVSSGIDETGAIIWNPRSIFNKDVSSNGFVQYMYSQAIPNTLRTIRIVGIAITLTIIVHLLAKITIRSKKGITIAKLLVNFFKWVVALASLFFILDAWGADTTTMLASAGVITLIIGLGSQSLVADILAGMFIVFEGDFQVGDIVIIDGWRGEVKEIGIRTTKLIDAGGNIKIINNSEIKTIINQTQELSIAKCYVAISYLMPIEKVEAVIADNLESIKNNIPAIVEGPYYKGVSELAESSVNLLFVAKCDESDIYQVQRDLNREIKIMFDKNDISIPFNQLDVHMVDDEPSVKVTKKDIQKAQIFADEQKELSKDVEIKHDDK